MILRFPRPTHTPEKNKFFTGIINALIICIPFWSFVAYIAWRW